MLLDYYGNLGWKNLYEHFFCQELPYRKKDFWKLPFMILWWLKVPSTRFQLIDKNTEVFYLLFSSFSLVFFSLFTRLWVVKHPPLALPLKLNFEWSWFFLMILLRLLWNFVIWISYGYGLYLSLRPMTYSALYHWWCYHDELTVSDSF